MGKRPSKRTASPQGKGGRRITFRLPAEWEEILRRTAGSRRGDRARFIRVAIWELLRRTQRN